MEKQKIINRESIPPYNSNIDKILVDTWALNSFNALYDIYMEYNNFRELLRFIINEIKSITIKYNMTWRYNNKLYLKVKEKKDVFNDIKKLARKLRKGKAFIEIPDKECTHNSIHSIRSFECTYDFLNSRASDELNILCAIVELSLIHI